MPESYNICLDVGGTKVLGAIFNEKDEIIYRLKKRSKSSGSGSTDVEKVIVSVVEEMIKESGIDRKKLNAIASCAPGVIDQDRGVVLFTPNLPWRDYDMAASILIKQFSVDLPMMINHAHSPLNGQIAIAQDIGTLQAE